jgi:2-oxoisovalerate dehydrogenase E2 component (dihydrolipoyl transacylase)
MARVFNLPDLGEGLEEAEIVEWKVAQGDRVELNQPLVEVNTAKALVEIPSPMAGEVTTLHGDAGDVIKVGQPLVTFATEEGPAEEGEGQQKREAVLVGYGVGEETQPKRRRRLRPPGPRKAPAAPEETATPLRAESPEPAGGGGSRAAPPVRRLAREMGVELDEVSGSGPEGRVTREDVLRAAEEPGEPREVPAVSDDEERVPVRGVRRLIAQKMTRSWTEIPHVTTFHSADATHVETLRRELTDTSGTKVSALAVVVRALADVCGRHPKLNASFDSDASEMVIKRRVDVGIATDTERGLMVPVVRDVAAKGIAEVAEEIAEVVETARAGRATPDQLTGSTITVTNVGTFGSSFGTPIINYPEAAILAVGRIEPRAVLREGAVEARPGVTLSLSFDHRIIDGADADRAMSDLRMLLEDPSRLGTLPR